MRLIKKKILILAPYPIRDPRHGGQKRAAAMVEFYQRVFEEVKFAAIFHKGSFPDENSYFDTDIPLGQKENLEAIDANPHSMELVIGRSIDNDIHVRSHIAKLLREYNPDIIQVEQAFLYDGLRILLPELGLKPKLIYSSQNIEYAMKRDIYKGVDMAESVSQPLIQATREIEECFSEEADLVIAVSESDAIAHRKMGAKKCVVAPNGIAPAVASKESLKHWKEFKSEHGIKQIITFVGSGHPPNWMGFEAMVGIDTGFLPKGAAIVLVGGISDYFTTTYPKSDKKNAKLWEHCIPVGQLTEDNLSGVLHSSDIILLPITQGGGSNLKTAEAVLSAKKVVATPYAFRGYEQYSELPNIVLADSRDAFREAIVRSLQAVYIKRSLGQRRKAQRVRWQDCLKPIIPAMKNVLHRSLYVRSRRLAGRVYHAGRHYISK